MLTRLKTKLSRFFADPVDIYAAIYPLFCICSVFGLAPYKIHRLEGGNKRVYKFAWIPLIRNVVLVVIMIGAFVSGTIFEENVFAESNIKEKLRYFQEIFSNLISGCAVIFGCIYGLKIVEVFKNIDQVDVAFRTLAVWVPYKKLYITIFVLLIALFIFMALIILQFAILSPQLFSFTFSFYWAFLITTTSFLPFLINLLMELQYCIYLNILRTRYRLFNEYLETLVKETKTSIWSAKGTEITTVSSSKSQQWPKGMVSISDPVFIVDQVAALHIKLTDTAHMINNAFCVQQLLRITVAFLSIVTALFLIAIKFSKGLTNDSETQLDYIFTSWAFSNALEVVTIVWITSETCEEANTCPRILHKIRNNTNNVNLQDTIEIYSLQMYHNRLYFTVCGLFPLDYTLLYTIVAGVTTYLVILIQFNSTDIVNVGTNNTDLMANFTINASTFPSSK